MTPATLPPAVWRDAEGLKRVITALTDGSGSPRIVGGAVRDTLLGLSVTDVDLATTLLPEAVIDRLEAAGIKAVPTGLDHGTVTAVADGKNYEITTLRRDVATDGRRAIVSFSTDWKEDAARRDFTFNALYAEPITGEIFDYFGGLADLDDGTVRFIGNPDERIAEDHLRILRYFRFLARFGEGAVDQAAIAACSAAANSLMALSRERIAGELLKLLALPDPRQSVSLMVRNKIFDSFLPECAGDAAQSIDRLCQREQEFGYLPSLPARLISIMVRNAAAVEKACIRLKLSNKLRIETLIRLELNEPSADSIRAFAYRRSVEAARDSAMLFADDEFVEAILERLQRWEVPAFQLKGRDLIKRGLTAGPIVAKILQSIEIQWIAEGFPAETRLNAIADQTVTEALSASKKS